MSISSLHSFLKTNSFPCPKLHKQIKNQTPNKTSSPSPAGAALAEPPAAKLNTPENRGGGKGENPQTDRILTIGALSVPL